MSISSDEINLLIQYYLQELGYTHAAFAFGCESQIPTKEISKRKVQPGSLVYLIQKGIMFANMEAAAEKALDEPSIQFAHQLNLLRNDLNQNSELVDELCASTRLMKVFPTPDQIEIRPFYLNNQSSLFLQGHQTPAIVCAWNKTSEYMATASEGGSILFWFFERQSNQTCVAHHLSTIQSSDSKSPNESKDITALSWSSFLEDNELLLASGNFNGEISIYKQGQEVNSISHHQTPIVEMHFSDNELNLLSAASGGTVLISAIDEASLTPSLLAQWEIKDEVVGAVWMNDQNSVLIASTKNLYIAKKSDTNPTSIFNASAPIIQLVSNVRYDLFIVGDEDGNVSVFDIQGSNIYTNNICKATICCLSISETSPFTFATGCANGLVNIISLSPMSSGNPAKISDIINTDSKIINFDGHISPAYCVTFDPNGKYLVSAAREIINVWSIEQKKLILSYIATCPVIVVTWSPDGRFLTICLFSGEVAVIDFKQLC